MKKVQIQNELKNRNLMKSGEYEVHILIEGTSGLSLERDKAIDALISVTVFGKKQYTKVKSNIGYQQTFWGQHFFFVDKFDSNISASNQKLVLQVFDRNRFLRNSLIGSFQVDVKKIYNSKDHCMKHQWFGLSNIDKNFSDITGYVKVSIAVMGQNDKNQQLSVEPISSITSDKKVLLPPHIQRKTYQLIVDIYQGKNIKLADGDSVDPYIGVQFGQIYEKTNTTAKNANPKFNCRLKVPLAIPSVTQKVSIRLIDANIIQSNQLLGSYYISIDKLIKQLKNQKDNQSEEQSQKNKKWSITEWINIYGPQNNSKYEDKKKIQQLFPQLATYYAGSLLLSAKVQEDSAPQKKNEVLSEKAPISPLLYHKVTAVISAALNLKQKSQKYSIMVRVGQYQVSTDSIKSKNGFCLWAVNKTLTVTTHQNQKIPDVFVYLMLSNTIVCYARFPAKIGQIVEDKWLPLKPDLSVVQYQQQQAGYLKIGLKMDKVNSFYPTSSSPIITGLKNIFEADRQSGKIVVELIAADSLIPLDDDGGSDPFFVISYMHKSATSVVRQKTLNPIYFQKIIIPADIPEDEESCPPIIVTAYDKDLMSKEIIGTTLIDIGEALRNHKSLSFDFDGKISPYWYDIMQNGVSVGRFLASFRLIRNNKINIPKEINIEKKKFIVNMIMLGLRGMKSTGILSVKKPYISFDYESLSLFGQDDSNLKMKNIVTEPNEEGSSVNIHTINKSTIFLPQNPDYWPSMSATVKDYVLGGIYQPTLGYFSIDLRKSYEQSKRLKRKLMGEDDVKIKFSLIDRFMSKPSTRHKLKNVHPNLLKSLKNFIVKAINYNWTIFSKSTVLNSLQKNNQSKINNSIIVVFPNYVKIDNNRYIQQNKQIIAKNEEYMAVGYDDKLTRSLPTLEKRNKHYRFVLDQPYDQYYQRAYKVGLGEITQVQIKKGKRFNSNDAMTTLIKKVVDQDSYVGMYKGCCYINEFKESQTEEDKAFTNHYQNIMQKFLKKSKYVLFLYVLQAANIPSKDITGLSDPYLIVKVGQQKFDMEKNAIENQSNPQFNQKFKINLQFPKDSVLEIQVWDQDPLQIDDFIGSAIIDLENRVISQMGNCVRNNPIQTHKLMAKQSKLPQGLIRFWMDIVPANELPLYRQFEIKPKQGEQLEVRVIVWGCTDIPIDDIEGMNDLFITCTFNDQTLRTDTHYRATDIGTFNWRMIFSSKMPLKDPTLTFRVYDQDLIGSNDFLSSGTIVIREQLDEVWESDIGMKLFLGDEDLSKYADCPISSSQIINGKRMYDRFELALRNKSSTGNESKVQGKLQISIEILTKQQAKKKPAAAGRDAPNQHPTLTDPKNRFQWSWNPITLLTRIVGRAVRYKVGLLLCCILIILLLYNFGYSYLGSIIGNITVPGK